MKECFTMSKRFWSVAILLAGLTCLTLGLGASAEEKDKKDAPASDPAAEAVKHIASALDLAELGRKEKEPELLIAAARTLRMIATTPGKEKVEVKGGKDELKDDDKAPSMTRMSDDLLAEAQRMAPDDKVIADLVQRVKEAKTRESIGGPRTYYHRPGAGTTIVHTATFIGGRVARVTVSGNGVNTLTLHVDREGGGHWTWISRNPHLEFVPGGTGVFTISVTNDGPGPVAYTLWHN
jgi:hypothetical protein